MVDSESDTSFRKFLEKSKKQVFITERKPVNIPPGPLKYAYIAYWSKFFDVSTDEVIRRVRGALFPFIGGSIFPDRDFGNKNAKGAKKDKGIK